MHILVEYTEVYSNTFFTCFGSALKVYPIEHLSNPHWRALHTSGNSCPYAVSERECKPMLKSAANVIGMTQNLIPHYKLNSIWCADLQKSPICQRLNRSGTVCPLAGTAICIWWPQPTTITMHIRTYDMTTKYLQESKLLALVSVCLVTISVFPLA